MKKVVHFEVHFVILYSKTELLNRKGECLFLDKVEEQGITHEDREISCASVQNKGITHEDREITLLSINLNNIPIHNICHFFWFFYTSIF